MEAFVGWSGLAGIGSQLLEPVFGERMGEGELATGRCGAAVEGRQSHR